ncbi:hypothetical protein Marme_3971 [Marinomonas mediterranea MMB-1]|uniref:Uncharacterized protein n=1 Tax=Marinomonas mediterranea (strain ATCC 700492 / JCM 21426 / NBRC 103028 / MMB-1) TaxID=717774 RepID=F2JZ94_MARM1|nr:hypothetical protein Marme_3971 [Marinomonas mediterranea MMB-1]
MTLWAAVLFRHEKTRGADGACPKRLANSRNLNVLMFVFTLIMVSVEANNLSLCHFFQSVANSFAT